LAFDAGALSEAMKSGRSDTPSRPPRTFHCKRPRWLKPLCYACPSCGRVSDELVIKARSW